MAWSDIFQGVKDAINDAQEKQKVREKTSVQGGSREAQNPVYSQGVSIEHGNGARASRPNVWESIARDAFNTLSAAQNQRQQISPIYVDRRGTEFDDAMWKYKGAENSDALTWRKLRVRNKDTGQDSYMEVGYNNLFDSAGPNSALDYIGGVRFYDDGEMNEYLDSAGIDEAIRRHFDLDATRYSIYDTDKRWMNDTVGGPYGNGMLTGDSAYEALLYDTDEAEKSGLFDGRFSPYIFSKWSVPHRNPNLDTDLTPHPTGRRDIGRRVIPNEEAEGIASNGTLWIGDPGDEEDPFNREPSLNPYDKFKNNLSLRESDKELLELKKYKNDILDLVTYYVFEPNYNKRKENLDNFKERVGIDGDNAYNKYGQKKIISDVIQYISDWYGNEQADYKTREERASWALQDMDEYLSLLRPNA